MPTNLPFGEVFGKEFDEMFLGADLAWRSGDAGDEERGEEGVGLRGENVEVCWKRGRDGGEEGVGEGGVGCGEGEEGEEDDDGGCC